MAKKVLMENSASEYFMELVKSAMENQHLELNELSEYYIVNLLVDHIKSEKIYMNMENGTHEEPLATILCEALKTTYHEEKVKVFKKLGDFTLFISGFFSDSLNRKIIDVDYYQSIGGTAYSNLAAIMKQKSQGEVFSELYSELSEQFQSITDVIAEVSDKSLVNSNKNILRVYERWMRSKGKRDETTLREEGIIPVAAESEYMQ